MDFDTLPGRIEECGGNLEKISALLKELFDSMDTDKSGYLDKSECAACFRKLVLKVLEGNPEFADLQLDDNARAAMSEELDNQCEVVSVKMMKAMDENSDGKVTFNEFLCGFQKMGEAMQ